MKPAIMQPARKVTILFLLAWSLAPGSTACGLRTPAPTIPEGSPLPTSQARNNAPSLVTARLVGRLEGSKKTSQYGPLHFGAAIALEGDTLAVGAPESTGMEGHQKGMVFVFQKEGGQWVEEAQLTPHDRDDPLQTDVHFGSSIALVRDTLLVGAPGADSTQGITDSGAVYLFQRQSGKWVETGILRASDPQANGRFGLGLKVRDNVLLVGGGYTGQSVYVFEREGQGWQETTRLAGENLGEKDTFGDSLALDSAHLAVGSLDYQPETGRYASGGITIFQRSGQAWVEETKLVSSENMDSGFGRALDLEGDTLVVSSGQSAAGLLSGAVIVYKDGPAGWQPHTRLVAADGAYMTGFGSSVDLQGDFLAVGAGADSSLGFWAGSAYLFLRQGEAWIDVLKLLPAEEDYSGAFFGSRVVLAGNQLLVAAPDEFGNAVYVYQISANGR